MATAAKAKRIFLVQQKEQMLKEHLDQGLSISAMARKHQINVDENQRSKFEDKT